MRAKADPVDPVDPVDPADPVDAAERAQATAWIAQYRRGEVSKTSDDPQVEYVATGGAACVPMPATRPPGFEVSYWEDPYEGRVELVYGIAANNQGVGACHFEWDLLAVDPPAGSCAIVEAASLDALYAELRALEIWRLEFEPSEPTPHSVGRGLLVRWPGSRCELLDVHGVSTVLERDGERFRAALERFRITYNNNAAG